MALILRHCMLSQKKRFVQEFLLFHRNVNGNTYNNNNIKKFGSILYVKHFSTENNENSDKQLIYQGPLTTQIRNLKIFSLSTSTISLIAQPIIYMRATEDDNLMSMGIIFSIISFIAVCSPLLIYYITRRHVCDLYYYPKEDMYAAEIFGPLLKKQQIQFNRNDVEVPEIGGMITSCTVHGKPLLLSEPDFKDVRHYFLIMGYNDPVDFEMGDNPANTDKIGIEMIREKLRNAEKTYKQIDDKRQEQN